MVVSGALHAEQFLYAATVTSVVSMHKGDTVTEWASLDSPIWNVPGGMATIPDGHAATGGGVALAGLLGTAGEAASVLDGFKICGCELNSPNMQLALLGLVVIPDLRISDKGLVDVSTFSFIPVFE